MFWKPEDQQKMQSFVAEATSGLARAFAPVLGAEDGLLRRFEAMIADYKKELHGLPDDAFSVDLAPLLQAMQRVSTGRGDERDQKIVGRFSQAMLQKMWFGPEYYVDPAQARAEGAPRAVVADFPWVRLYRYAADPAVPRADAPPVLIIYSFINQPYILDLSAKLSVIRDLLARGLDVFLIEWGEVRPHGAETTLDEILTSTLPRCVEAVRGATGASKVSLFGHCIGGTLALWYAALAPDDVASLFLLTAPLGAPSQGILAVWTDEKVLPVDAIVAQHGLMPAKLIRHTFVQFKPWTELLKWKMFVENLANDAVMERFALVDGWANDNRDIPGPVFAPFIHEVYQSTRCRDGASTFGGRQADWRSIRVPILHVVGGGDWIVARDSACPWPAGEGPTVEVVEVLGGHLGYVLDARARPTWERVATFFVGAQARG